MRIAELARDVVADAIRAAGGNVSNAADSLGLNRTQLHQSLRRHPEWWPDGVERLGRGRPMVLTDAQVIAAVSDAGDGRGRWARAAKALRCPVSTLRDAAARLGLG
jgi:transcriptional regulator with GAF, ATPase, and Fis domain